MECLYSLDDARRPRGVLSRGVPSRAPVSRIGSLPSTLTSPSLRFIASGEGTQRGSASSSRKPSPPLASQRLITTWAVPAAAQSSHYYFHFRHYFHIQSNAHTQFTRHPSSLPCLHHRASFSKLPASLLNSSASSTLVASHANQRKATKKKEGNAVISKKNKPKLKHRS